MRQRGVSNVLPAGELPLEGAEALVPVVRLAQLFDLHHQRLYRLARRLSRDAEAAQDLVQETFLRAAARPSALPGEPSAGAAWLTRVLVNLCHDRFRRLAVRRAHAATAKSAADRHETEAAALARLTVEAALSTLPVRRRAIVVLAELEGLDTAEISRLLGISRVTVRWHLATGRKQLARHLLTGAVASEEETR